MFPGFFLKTRDFLQPPERGKEEDAVPAERPPEQALPGEVGTYAIGHAAGAVKPERRGCSEAPGFPAGLETKPEPEYCGRTTTTASYRHAGGASYTPWDDNDTDSEDLTIKVDGKAASCIDQRPNNPRSKHSATEQRRRSKINDRQVNEKCLFQILRELIPHSDQKRDKASFLMEVIRHARGIEVQYSLLSTMVFFRINIF
ncbi:hypothetical protein B296_00031626 [Ensete ventricosum]|uniref:BHLH domain-containing protein n=1 Tax=Ensete ventricosum TaxID=4639 RepID=A0A427AFQ5_ENSVE|nr:hypothetical protein B296_00031626 [Ensete ventricosum]